ncbi:MAG: hypothetical protein ABSF08_12905 [Candidatus Cybelea sp.]|jgi:hypothetical protein
MRLAPTTFTAILAAWAVALIAGCSGGSQGPAAALPAAGSTRMQGASANRGQSWMLARAKTKTLIYAQDEQTGNVNVYDYSSGTQVGTLAGSVADGGCVDAKGDVYIVADSGTVVEYAHGGTTPLQTYDPGGFLVGCSIDSKGDVAITGSSPGRVIVYSKGDAKKGASYSDTACETMSPMGYDDKGNAIGAGQYNDVSVCALLAGTKQEATLSTSGITINFPNGTMWDGKYIVVGDQEATSGKDETGMIQATLSGKTLTSTGETILTDTCYRGYTDVRNPFVVGKKNTPVNAAQGNVVVGSNLYCFSSSNGGIEFWHYPKGGDPFKMYGTQDEITVLAVSIGT